MTCSRHASALYLKCKLLEVGGLSGARMSGAVVRNVGGGEVVGTGDCGTAHNCGKLLPAPCEWCCIEAAVFPVAMGDPGE